MFVCHSQVLEACMKNCGAPIHKEVATKDMMDTFRELAKVRLKKPTTSVQFSSVLFSPKTMNKNTGLQQYKFTSPGSSVY